MEQTVWKGVNERSLSKEAAAAAKSNVWRDVSDFNASHVEVARIDEQIRWHHSTGDDRRAISIQDNRTGQNRPE